MMSGRNDRLDLTGLAKNYGYYFGDEEIVSDSEDWLYICDSETYDMLLFQQKKDNRVTDKLGDWHGRKCYEFMEGKDHPCEFCPLKNLRRDNYYFWTHKNEMLGVEAFLKVIDIDWNGRRAMLHTGTNINSQVRRNEVMTEYLLSRNALTSVLSCLMDENPIEDNFSKICGIIGSFFGADRALITDYTPNRLNAAWSKSGEPFTQIATTISDEEKKNITDATIHLRYLRIEDVSAADKLDPRIREYWTACGIRSILLIPMHYNGDFIGTISLHNIRSHFPSIETLNLVGMSVAKCIHAYGVERGAEEKLYTDPLTGIPNFASLKRRSAELMVQHPDTTYFFCVMDIKFFSLFNRRYSYQMGDKVLISAADILKRNMHPDEACCRISADQFCFFAKYPKEDAENRIRRRFDRFNELIQDTDVMKSVNYKLEFQCGIYVFNEKISISEAIDKANLARRSLKSYQSSDIAFYSSELMDGQKRETELIQDFKSALKNHELSVYFQPQCNYAQNKMVGAEALVRWHSPKHGNVSPAEFIPILERHGMIYKLDRYVWEQVCIYQRKWLDMGIRCPISVNVSRYDVLREDICKELCGLLEKYDIPKELLPIEITETAYIKNSDELINVVDRLKALGFTVEMDDFGSGYSSLNALKDVAVDLIKLDMKFLDAKDTSGKGGSILNCIVRMTRWLGLEVLAEGVETREQAEYLKNIGCDFMQGYYFSRPIPAEEFEKKLVSSQPASSDNPVNSGVTDVAELMDSVMSNPLFFDLMGPAAIAESGGNDLEALMINDSFFKMLGCTREEYQPYFRHMDRYDKLLGDREHSIAHFKSSISDKLTHDFTIMTDDGTVRRIRTFCRKLFSDGDKDIFLMLFDDISEMK